MQPPPVLPPALLQPPPRDPAGAKLHIASRSAAALRMLGGVWAFVALLVFVVVVRGRDFADGTVGLVAAGACGFGLVMSATVAVNLGLARSRSNGLFSRGLLATGRVRSVQPNISPDYPARIEIEFIEADGRLGVGFFAIPWTKASWLNPGMNVPVMYVPGDRKLFGVYLENMGVMLGGRLS